MSTTTIKRSARLPRNPVVTGAEAAGLVTGGIITGLASLAFSTYLVMLLVGAVHSSVPAVPAVGFVTTLAGVVAARIAVKG